MYSSSRKCKCGKYNVPEWGTECFTCERRGAKPIVGEVKKSKNKKDGKST